MTAHRLILPFLATVLAALAPATPALAATLEEPLTETPTPIAGTTATFHGELNKGSSSAKVAYRFAYSAGAGAACTESGLTAPREPPFPEAEGNHKEVSQAVTKLEGSTEYGVCLIAANPADSEEATQGNTVTFKTPAVKPLVESENATSVSPFAETLEGSVNPENQETTYHLEYAEDSTFTGAKTLGYGIAGPGVSSGQPVGPAQAEGLAASTTYYYRVVAKNATGEEQGPTQEFTTASGLPKIESEPAPGEEYGVTVGRTTAQLTAIVNPELQETTCVAFDYGLTESYGSEAPCRPNELGRGGYGEVTRANLTGLTPNSEYHYQVVASNATGTGEGATALGDKTFLTLPEPPVAGTGVASATSSRSATVPGSVDPGSSGVSSAQKAQDATSYYVEYGGTTAYGRRTPAIEVGEGTSAIPVTVSLRALEPGTTYHYRLVASNLNNAVAPREPQLAYGEDKTFETPSTPPILSDVAVSGVTQSGATITATLEPQGLPTRYALEVGLTAGLLLAQSAGDTSSVGPVAVTLGSAEALSPGTVYYYTLTATNANGTVTATGSFVTAPGPAGAVPGGLPAVIPYQSIAELNAKEAREDRGIPAQKPLTNAEKLSKALKGCRKKHNKHKRATCEKQAHKKYATVKRTT